MNELLDLGKPISAANLQALPLLKHCRETIEIWKISGMVENRQVLITAEQDATDILVTADSSKLQQVIFNLLENAGHYTPAESTITMHLAVTAPGSGMAIVRIIDSGQGIPEKNLSRVFEPFYSNRRGGTGLGLSLVKHFIENMGGSVRIWNNDPPPGCTAELFIPLSVKEHA
jgi:signal transduction histidine kinase